MKTPSISSAYYSPGLPPQDAAEMQRFVLEELKKVSAAITALAAGHLDKSNAAPVKPREGDIRLADGSAWAAGSGYGLYFYNGTAWLPVYGNGKAVVNNNAAGTYTVAFGINYVGFIGTNATTIAFTFPAASAAIDGWQIRIYTTAAVSVSSTWASTGATFVGAPATLAAASVTRFVYHHATAQWLPG